jgi:hypothetical protein
MSDIASEADGKILFIAGRMPGVANVRWLTREYCLHDEVCVSLDWALLELNPALRECRSEEDIMPRREN